MSSQMTNTKWLWNILVAWNQSLSWFPCLWKQPRLSRILRWWAVSGSDEFWAVWRSRTQGPLWKRTAFWILWECLVVGTQIMSPLPNLMGKVQMMEMRQFPQISWYYAIRAFEVIASISNCTQKQTGSQCSLRSKGRKWKKMKSYNCLCYCILD